MYLLFDTVKCQNKSEFRPPQVYANLLRVGNVNCGHLKATFVEAWTATQFLDDLHHHPLQSQTHVSSIQLGLPGRRRDTSEGTYLSVRLAACFIRLAEVEHQFVSTFLAQLLHDVEGAFAQGLTHRVEEHKYQIGLFSCTGKKKKTLKKYAASGGRYNSKDIPNHVMALLTSKG